MIRKKSNKISKPGAILWELLSESGISQAIASKNMGQYENYLTAVIFKLYTCSQGILLGLKFGNVTAIPPLVISTGRAVSYPSIVIVESSLSSMSFMTNSPESGNSVIRA